MGRVDDPSGSFGVVLALSGMATQWRLENIGIIRGAHS